MARFVIGDIALPVELQVARRTGSADPDIDTVTFNVRRWKQGDAGDGDYYTGAAWSATPTTVTSVKTQGHKQLVTIDQTRMTGMSGWRIEISPNDANVVGEMAVLHVLTGLLSYPVDAVANLVLDALLSAHQVSDSFGELFQQGSVVTGAAVNSTASSYTLTTGDPEINDVTDTYTLDGVEHQHTDLGGALDLYYEAIIGGDGIPTGFLLDGRLNSANDSLPVYAYNWAGLSWDQIGTLVGKGGAANDPHNYDATTAHVGTGANLGRVRFRLSGTGLTSAALYIDRLLFRYAVVNRSIGYANGAIWVDTTSGNTGVQKDIDGVADNPVGSWADAITVAGLVGVKKFQIANGSSVTLTGDASNFIILGEEWGLDLGGQVCSDAAITGAHVTGLCTGDCVVFRDCELAADGGMLTSASMEAHECALSGDIVITGPGAHIFDRCYSGVAGEGSPSIDLGAAVLDSAINFRLYSGGIRVKNMGSAGTDTMSLEGFGQLTIDSTCQGGNISVRGIFPKTDEAAGRVTVTEIGRITTLTVRDTVWDAPIADHQDADSTGEILANAGGTTTPSFIASAVWDALGTAYNTPGSMGSIVQTAVGGGGSETVTIQINDDLGAPISGAQVDIYDATGVFFKTRVWTDILGQIDLRLDQATYSLYLFTSGYSYTSPVSLVVGAGPIAVTYVGTRLGIVDPPSNPDHCKIYGYVRDVLEVPVAGALVEVYAVTPQAVNGIQKHERIGYTETRSDGFFEISVGKLTLANFKIAGTDIDFEKTVPNLALQEFTAWP